MLRRNVHPNRLLRVLDAERVRISRLLFLPPFRVVCGRDIAASQAYEVLLLAAEMRPIGVEDLDIVAAMMMKRDGQVACNASSIHTFVEAHGSSPEVELAHVLDRYEHEDFLSDSLSGPAHQNSRHAIAALVCIHAKQACANYLTLKADWIEQKSKKGRRRPR